MYITLSMINLQVSYYCTMKIDECSCVLVWTAHDEGFFAQFDRDSGTMVREYQIQNIVSY